jgi:hypothetical protein
MDGLQTGGALLLLTQYMQPSSFTPLVFVPLLFFGMSGLLSGNGSWAQESSAGQISGHTDVSLCSLSREALNGASAVRGLEPRAAVPCVVEDKAAVTQFIHETIREDLPPQKLVNEEVAYKAIGLIPESFDYQHALVDFLVGQIGGYYNPKKKLFVMAGWLPASVQGGVAVHELTHALQDQHYNLTVVMNAKKATTDSGLAASALVEGDASAVMFDYERVTAGQDPLRTVSSVDSMLLLQVLGLGFGGDVPESLKALLIFPYTSGLRFVHSLLRRGGYADVHKAYGRIPTTTREILHPEEYAAASFTPQIPQDSELEATPEGVAPVYTDVLGEFGVSTLFRGVTATKDRGPSAAAGWVGDKLGVFPTNGGVRVISWLTRWESEDDAREFKTLYSEYLGSLHRISIDESEVTLSQSRSARLTQRGRDVSLVITERISTPGASLKEIQ